MLLAARGLERGGDQSERIGAIVCGQRRGTCAAMRRNGYALTAEQRVRSDWRSKGMDERCYCQRNRITSGSCSPFEEARMLLSGRLEKVRGESRRSVDPLLFCCNAMQMTERKAQGVPERTAWLSGKRCRDEVEGWRFLPLKGDASTTKLPTCASRRGLARSLRGFSWHPKAEADPKLPLMHPNR